MFDFFADPGWVVLFGAVGAGVAKKSYFTFVSKQRSAVVASPPEPMLVYSGDEFDVQNPRDEFLCSVWEIRHREAHPFLGSGFPVVAMEQRTTCSDEACGNCLPTRRLQSKILADKKIAEIKAKIAEEKRLSQLAAEQEERKYSVVQGMRVRRPEGVPFGAVGTIRYDASTWQDYIYWRWTSPGGKPMGVKQPVQVESLEEVRVDGSIVMQWQAVYDPDTGEHLGDYRNRPGYGAETRKPVIHFPNRIEKAKVAKQFEEIMRNAKPKYYNMASDHKVKCHKESTGDLGPR